MRVNGQVVAQGNDGSAILQTAEGSWWPTAPTLMPADYASRVLQMINTAGGIDPVTAAQIANQARQFDAGLQLDVAQDNAQAIQRANEFNASNQIAVDQANASNELRVAEANQAAKLRVAETNASLRAQQAALAEQVRQFDIQDARERENMRFLLRKEQVAVEEGNRTALQKRPCVAGPRSLRGLRAIGSSASNW